MANRNLTTRDVKKFKAELADKIRARKFITIPDALNYLRSADLALEVFAEKDGNPKRDAYFTVCKHIQFSDAEISPLLHGYVDLNKLFAERDRENGN